MRELLQEGIARLRRIARDQAAREFLWYCAPALFVGLALRVWLTLDMPFGYVHQDTPDFFVTAYKFLTEGHFELHNKKTFLEPILFALFLFLGFPALITIPLAQHCLGLLVIVMMGALVRWWFKFWRWFIVPCTSLAAVNPDMLWYEQTPMAEPWYLFCVLGLALAGTAFARFRTKRAFYLLLLAAFFTAGARPEGSLFFAFCFLLVLFACWGDWREAGAKLTAVLLLGAGTVLITKTEQGGVLLYASVLPMAPDTPPGAPDFGPWIVPFRDELRARSEKAPRRLVKTEKALSDIVGRYLWTKGVSKKEAAAFCQRRALEICLARPASVPLLAVNKFLMGTAPLGGGDVYDATTLYATQLDTMTYRDWFLTLSGPLTGRDLWTREEVRRFLVHHYSIPLWLLVWQDAWKAVALDWRFPSRSRDKAGVLGLPCVYAVALAGMLAATVGPGPLRLFHISWLLTLGGVLFVVILTGVILPRYRFVFDPFCILYGLFLFDTLAALWTPPTPATPR